MTHAGVPPSSGSPSLPNQAHTHKHHTCNLQALGHSHWWDAKVSLVQYRHSPHIRHTHTHTYTHTHTHTRTHTYTHTHTHTQSPTLTTQYMRRAPGDKTFLHRARRTAITDRKQVTVTGILRDPWCYRVCSVMVLCRFLSACALACCPFEDRFGSFFFASTPSTAARLGAGRGRGIRDWAH